MKNRLVLLALTGVLALSASAPNAMASSVGNHATTRPNAVSRPSSRAVTKKVGSTFRQVKPNARPGSHAAK